MTPEQAYEWLAPKLSTEERNVLDVIYRPNKSVGFGCHCDLEPGQKPDSCVLDIDRTQDCVYAGILLKNGQGRNDCKYWRIVEA